MLLLNFAFLTFASLFEAAAMMLTSIMLEKIVSIASSDSLDDLITQGIIFITVLALAAVVYGLMLHIRPKYRKKAIQQYKNNIYEHLLKKSISDLNIDISRVNMLASAEIKKEVLFRQFNLMEKFPFKRRMHIVFSERVIAPTPGQTAALYDGNIVIGSGIIE